MWKHWTIRTSTPYEPFRNYDDARWFWIQLQRKLPKTLGAVLMPNHFHLILPLESDTSETQNRDTLAGVIGSFSSRLKERGLWQHQGAPTVIPDRYHLRRNLRYVALNPCRKSLCKDPLEWPWSTYRDLFGSSVNPWITGEKIARVLGENEIGFKSRFHNYVSSDPTVDVVGTPLPKTAVPRTFAEDGIITILNATSAALRVPVSHVQRPGPLRDLFVHLACQQGWRKPMLLAEICRVTPRAIQTIISRGSPLGLGAAMLCLGDTRLRKLPAYLSGGESQAGLHSRG